MTAVEIDPGERVARIGGGMRSDELARQAEAVGLTPVTGTVGLVGMLGRRGRRRVRPGPALGAARWRPVTRTRTPSSPHGSPGARLDSRDLLVVITDRADPEPLFSPCGLDLTKLQR